MLARSTRRRAGQVVLALLIACAGGIAVAAPAQATPWGTGGADYDGVLCHLDTADVPMGSWTVNGTVPAFSTVDVTGTALVPGPAPVSGTPTTMAPGDAGLGADDIAALAYLLDANQNGSSTTLAEVSAEVALVAGSGQSQQRCLGQNGTSASRAAALLATARRLAGPYTVEVAPEQNVIPGAEADVAITVRSASGAGVRGLDVTVTAGGGIDTVTTGRDGQVRATLPVPAAPATQVSASVQVPTRLTYLQTSPPSVAAAPPTTVTGSGVLRPVLHPHPTVAVSSDLLALAGKTLSPTLDVNGTYGYSGTGQIALLGPVPMAAGGACSAVSDDALANAPAAWQQDFTFRGDVHLDTGPTPELAAGCYAVRARLTTTDSSPPVSAASRLVPVTVAAISLTTKATGPAAPPGGLAATVVATDPGRAVVRTSVVARGPLPISRKGCTGDFGDAPEAGTSGDTTLRTAGTVQQATLKVPDVRSVGCYALVARNEITLDGRSTSTTTSARGATMAILKPAIAVSTTALSSEQGKSVPGSVRVTGTFGFPGAVAIGVVQGETLPITGCASTRFAAGASPAGTSRVATKGDATYPFRAPPPAHIACYAVVASFTLTGNPAVRADSGTPSAIFLAGKSPESGIGTVVQKADTGSSVRAIVAYSVFGFLILAGCAALFARTFLVDRRLIPAGSPWPWRPHPSR